MGARKYVVGGVCRRGHNLTGSNVYTEGERIRCRECHNIQKTLPTGYRPKKVARLVIGEQCSAGHDLTLENTYVYPDGKLACKQCRIKSSRKHAGYNGDMDDPIGRWKGDQDKKECIEGHSYAEFPPYIDGKGMKHCVLCRETASFRRRAKKYDLTPEELQSLIDEQGERCALCGETWGKTLHVDHCHATGKTRRLLCGNCNNGLGMFSDSKRKLLSAVLYLAEADGGLPADVLGAVEMALSYLGKTSEQCERESWCLGTATLTFTRTDFQHYWPGDPRADAPFEIVRTCDQHPMGDGQDGRPAYGWKLTSELQLQ